MYIYREREKWLMICRAGIAHHPHHHGYKTPKGLAGMSPADRRQRLLQEEYKKLNASRTLVSRASSGKWGGSL